MILDVTIFNRVSWFCLKKSFLFSGITISIIHKINLDISKGQDITHTLIIVVDELMPQESDIIYNITYRRVASC